MSSKIDTLLAIDTVNLAVADRGKSSGIIFHTDRGCQFTSSVFRSHLDNLNMIQSFSAKGHPYDNAVMDCFFKYLKKEEVNRRSFFHLLYGFYHHSYGINIYFSNTCQFKEITLISPYCVLDVLALINININTRYSYFC